MIHPPCCVRVMSPLPSVIVVGTGKNYLEEFSSLREQHPDADVMAVNGAISTLPVPITHAVSMHPAEMRRWLKSRSEQEKGVMKYHTVPSSQMKAYEYLLDYPWMDMTSGMFAVKVAMELGYDKIYLAGMPLDHENNLTPMRDLLLTVKDQFDKVIVPDNYWWKEFITINGDN